MNNTVTTFFMIMSFLIPISFLSAQDAGTELAKQEAEAEAEIFYEYEVVGKDDFFQSIKVRKAVPIEEEKGFAYKNSIKLSMLDNEVYLADISDYDGDSIADAITVIQIAESLTTAIGFYRGPKHYEYRVKMGLAEEASIPPTMGIINIDLESPFIGKTPGKVEYTPVEKGKEIRHIEKQFKRADDIFKAVIKDKISLGTWNAGVICELPFLGEGKEKYPFSWFSTVETEKFRENIGEAAYEWEMLYKKSQN